MIYITGAFKGKLRVFTDTRNGGYFYIIQVL